MNAGNKINKINIVALERAHEANFNKWWEDDKSSFKLKYFLTHGKVLSLEIAEARKKKFKYLNFKGFILNINNNPGLISPQDLTKTRFFALIHRFIHKKYHQETDESEKNSYEVSALVIKVNFTPDCCLTPIRFLLGTGFQHQHDVIIKDNSSCEDKITFVIGCMVLDWLSGIAEKSPRKKITARYKCFKDYALSEDARSGEVLAAGARGINDKELSLLRNEGSMKILQDSLGHITFNNFKSVVDKNVAELFSKIAQAYSDSPKSDHLQLTDNDTKVSR